jgi:PAS domain S-box-containing protein
MSMRIGSKELRRVAAPTPPPPSALATEKFFELSADMLCLAGLDGYFKILNQAWSETLGYQDEELLRVPYLEFVHPDDRAATLIEAAKLGKGFKTVNFRNRYRCKDGQYKWLAWTATPVLDNGTIYAAARDITDEVAAEEGGRQVVHDQRARVMAAMGGDGVVPVFQPILSIPSLQVIGFEALSRFHIPPMRPPDQWFDDASAAGLRTRLEIHAIRRAMEQVCNLPADTFLSINASPATLLSEDFSDAVTGLEGERLVVEVTEHATVEVYEPLQKAIDSLRRRGVRLAIDDAGAGFSSLKHIVRLVPEFIKLDLFLIRDINVDPVKRAVVAGMLGVATQIGGRVIGEGVETEEELRVLVDLGVHCAQGFYLALPRPLT